MAAEGKDGYMTPFENFVVNEKLMKKPSGVATAGLVTAVGAVVVGAAAWAFAGQVSRNAERNLDRLAGYFAAEHTERLAFQQQVILHNGGYGGCGYPYGYNPFQLGATNQPQPIAVTMCEPAHVRHRDC